MTTGTVAPPPCSSRNANANVAPTQLPVLPLVPLALPHLPASRAEMERRGWDEVDVVFVTGDAYVDHPAFAMGILGRVLEAAGFRVAILSQPDWRSAEPWRQFGRPRLFFGISAGNMDSMINHYTANKKVRNDDAYSPGGRIGLRPDRATLPYCQRAREAFPGVPVIAGGVEASLRRLAHYDYWSDTVKRSILLDSKADLVVFGMGEQPIVEIARRLAAGESVRDLRDMRGVAYALGAKEDAAGRRDRAPLVRGGEGGQATSSPRRPRSSTRRPTRSTPRRLVQYHDRQAVVANPPRSADQPGGHGPDLRPALHAPAASDVQGREDPRLRDGEGFGHDHARLLRRLHLLLDHRAPGPDHPVAVAGVGPDRTPADGRGPELLGHRLRHRRPDGQHVPDALHAARGRGQVQAAVVRPPQGLQAARDRPRPARPADAREPRSPGRPQGPGRLGGPHGPGAAVPRVHGGARRAPRRRPPQGRPRAHRPRRPQADEEARDQRLRGLRRRLPRGERQRRARSSSWSPTSSPRTRAATWTR